MANESKHPKIIQFKADRISVIPTLANPTRPDSQIGR